jgi:hypothetical protein
MDITITFIFLKHNVSETGSVSVITYKGMRKVPTQ